MPGPNWCMGSATVGLIAHRMPVPAVVPLHEICIWVRLTAVEPSRFLEVRGPLFNAPVVEFSVKDMMGLADSAAPKICWVPVLSTHTIGDALTREPLNQLVAWM